MSQAKARGRVCEKQGPPDKVGERNTYSLPEPVSHLLAWGGLGPDCGLGAANGFRGCCQRHRHLALSTACRIKTSCYPYDLIRRRAQYFIRVLGNILHPEKIQ